MLVPSRKACETLGISANTIRKWADEGKISYIRTAAGQRRYDVAGFLRDHAVGGKRRVVYVRVSSRAQRDDLESQTRALKARFPSHEVVEDVGSGLNFKRKWFRALLDDIVRGGVEEIVVAHRDRLCRFGFELFEAVASFHNCRIVVLDDARLSPSDELVRDLVSIVHVFSCRLYGLRKYGRAIQEDSHLSEERREPLADEKVRRDRKVLVQPSGCASPRRRDESKPRGSSKARSSGRRP